MEDDDLDLVPFSLIGLFESLEKKAWALVGAINGGRITCPYRF